MQNNKLWRLYVLPGPFNKTFDLRNPNADWCRMSVFRVAIWEPLNEIEHTIMLSPKFSNFKILFTIWRNREEKTLKNTIRSCTVSVHSLRERDNIIYARFMSQCVGWGGHPVIGHWFYTSKSTVVGHSHSEQNTQIHSPNDCAASSNESGICFL